MPQFEYNSGYTRARDVSHDSGLDKRSIGGSSFGGDQTSKGDREGVSKLMGSPGRRAHVHTAEDCIREASDVVLYL